MLIRIDPDLSTPVYEQIVEQIVQGVRAGELVPGERLPSVRQLAGDLALAVNTVAKAYRQLEAAGLLQTRVGAGTRVHPEASTTPAEVIERARALATTAASAGVSLEDTIRIVRAVWPNPPALSEEPAANRSR